MGLSYSSRNIERPTERAACPAGTPWFVGQPPLVCSFNLHVRCWNIEPPLLGWSCLWFLLFNRFCGLGGSFNLHFNKDSCAKVSSTNHFLRFFSGYLGSEAALICIDHSHKRLVRILVHWDPGSKYHRASVDTKNLCIHRRMCFVLFSPCAFTRIHNCIERMRAVWQNFAHKLRPRQGHLAPLLLLPRGACRVNVTAKATT